MITSNECERKEVGPDTTPLLQSILGTDKRNPVFSVSRQPGAEPKLHVYYGAELLEVVPEDQQHPAYKLLIGRLFNAGVKQVALQRSFGVDRKTMRRWGRALQSDDPERLVRVLAGRGGQRKLTPEIRAFVILRFPKLYSQSRTGYSQQLRTEIATVFGVRLSGECLRPLLKTLKAELRQEVPAPGEARAGESEPSAALAEPTVASSLVPESSAESASLPVDPMPSPSVEAERASPVETENRATACVGWAEPAPVGPLQPVPLAPPILPPPGDRKPTPILPVPEPTPPTTSFCHHVGVLLFSKVLWGLEQHVATEGWLLKQWLATLLLGAVNIEQTKLLDFEALERLLGRTLRSRFPQRCQLKELAAAATTLEVLDFNAQWVDAAQQRDFYFDPHTKHYTGQQPILKGWCATLRWADKVLHSDCFHTVSGQPVYLDCADNYQDMRQRFAALRPPFRQAVGLPATAVVTYIMDRGIFSHDVFTQAIAAPDYHLITWEKNYQPGQWDPQKRAGEYVLERKRNHAQDLRLYRFEYMDRDWAKNPKMRQLIVRATNPQGRLAEMGVLTDDRHRAAAQIIHLIFNRWTQENDYKYLDQHFGIDQITSYASVPYEQLKDQVEDKQVHSGAYKALGQQIAQLQCELRKLLLAEHQHPGKCKARTEQIKTLTEQLAQARQEQAQAQKEVSRLESLIQQQMVRLDTRNKRLMDSLKFVARNAFYQALEPFKTAYNNYRDDHEMFRNLTHADGFVVESEQQVQVYLLPTVNYPPALAKIVRGLLTEINATHPQMPDGTGRPLQFHLGQKLDIQVAIVS
jgi:hypothetical protein